MLMPSPSNSQHSISGGRVAIASKLAIGVSLDDRGGRSGGCELLSAGHPQRLQLAVAPAPHVAPVSDALPYVVERLPGQALAGEDVGDPGGVGGQALGGDPAGGGLARDALLGAEEALAWGQNQLAPWRWRRQLLVRRPRIGLQLVECLAEAGD